MWKLLRSYFSFGEWMLSSSRPNPISTVSRPSVRLKSATIGIDAPEPILAFFREDGAERIACVFNMSGERHVFGDERLDGGQMLPAGAGEARLDGGALHLGPYAARLVKVS